MVVSLWLAQARAAECPGGPLGPSELAALLDEADAAFVELEIPTFIALSDRVRSSIPCLDAPAGPALVARLHRTEGLRLFGERNVDAVRVFAAARSVEPDYVFPSDVVPSGSPILDDYSAMDLDAGEIEVLPEPLAGSVWVDGRETRERPLAWPTLVQIVASDGHTVDLSVYLRHDAPAPLYPAAPVFVPEPEALIVVPPAPVAIVRRSTRVPLMVAAGTSAALGGVLYGAAWATRSSWIDPETPDAELPRLRARTNGLAIASAASGTAMLGLGTALAFTW